MVSLYNIRMPHIGTSCRGRGVVLLRSELALLYAQRSALQAAIRELELRQAHEPPAATGSQNNTLEFSSRTCNLTSCRERLDQRKGDSVRHVSRYACRARTD